MSTIVDFLPIGTKRTQSQRVDSTQESGQADPKKVSQQPKKQDRNSTSIAADHRSTNPSSTQAIDPMLRQLLKRQRRSGSQNKMTNEQQRLQVLDRISQKAPSAAEKARNAKEAQKQLTIQNEQIVKTLIAEMDQANEVDHSILKQKFSNPKPQQSTTSSSCAMNRFNMLSRVESVLQKKPLQNLFLELGGCLVLQNWLLQQPDLSFPPVQVVEMVFQVLEKLPLQIEHLQECDIARVIQLYASDRPGLGQRSISRATHLLQRWQVTVYNLSYEYDQDGYQEIKQKELKRKLAALTDFKQKNHKYDSQSLGFDEGRGFKDDELIRKAANGKMVMYKSNFDFLEKPKPQIPEADQEKKGKVHKVGGDKREFQLNAKAQITACIAKQKKRGIN